MHHVYRVIGTTSEERAECSRGWVGGGGGDFQQLHVA